MEKFVTNSLLNDNISKILKFNPITFLKDEVITTYIENRDQIGIIVSGKANLVRYDINGNKVIIEEFISNDLFGEFFFAVNNNNELQVIATEECKIIFFNYYNLFNGNFSKGQNYYEVIAELFKRIANILVEKNLRIEILSKRSIREKLLSYFESKQNEYHNRVFILDITLNDLADYLSIDRCAMMREIKNLIDDGIIKKNGKKITLIEH